MDDKHTANPAAHPPLPSATGSTWLHVPSMCCAAEFNAVEKELMRLEGVREVSPDFIRRSVRVQHDAVPDPALVTAAARSGFEVRLASGAGAATAPRGKGLSGIGIKAVGTGASPAPLEPSRQVAEADHEHEHDHRDEHAHGDDDHHLHSHASDHADAPSNTKLIVGGVLALAAEGMALVYGDASWPAVALAISAIVLAGLGTYRKGLIALRHFNLNINALMTVAVTGAAIIGQWPEAAMVMVLFAIAEMIEDKSLDRARRAVEGLMSMAPDMATVQQGSAWQEMPAASVALGALVRVRPGERIALDGAVESGTSAVDQAAITGESVPVDKAVGDKLFAGTINQNGELLYRVSALADDSTLARIIRAVQEAQATRAPTQRFVDSFARVYTPAVFAVAMGMAVVPPVLMGAEWMTWIYRALVLLVIACPCALVLSTPISVVSGLTAAARRGILVKGGLYLEQGHRLKVLALDKTGTLTQGKPVVTDVLTLQGHERDMLARAVALAGRSDHPVSKAIAAHGQRSAFKALDVTGFQALQGRGTEGLVDGERIRLGNHRLLEESNACTPELEAQLDALEVQGKTAVVLVRGEQAVGIFAIADQVRAESAEAIAQLKALGVRPIMLTGDNRHTAEAMARLVGIDDVRSELLPEDKLKVIEALAADGRTVVGMVGDGINDAPALAKAHIGFAMGAAGTDTAIETADIALMDDDPRKLAEFIRLSRATRAVLWQNIVFALGIKVVFLTLAVTGQATLWMAVFADMGASLLVVFNGLRLLRHRAGN
ncbi:heavy metal translocating P-type ATPase [Hydrogenophaga sp.]|uniref:heavy metal translocating P-type ATPase n=1 Tax=Hydrogenophaga sp. TaxID=1904254 RepID=UPI002718FC0D|nr:heavy metal translocating P-type ATPase [Hydrogenophaga sp.]MDO9435607.1 heavy metal translocating P-type ATPase [Hydrogenophaga sp.]